MQFDRFASTTPKGAVLAHSVKAGDVVLRKGRLLSSEDIERLRAAGVDDVVAARIGSADVAEDEAAAELAAMAAASVEVGAAFTGRANLHATARGCWSSTAERSTGSTASTRR